MKEASIIGLDLSKRSFQAHGALADGSVAFRKKLTREKVLGFYEGEAKERGQRLIWLEDATQAAYDREEMLAARRVWMERWAQFLSGETSDNVVPLRRGAAGE